VNVLAVTGAALATAFATGLGPAPFLAFPRPSRRLLGVSAAVAAGFMLAASGALVAEGAMKGVGRMLVGALAGALIVALAHRAIPKETALAVGTLRGADARKAALIIAIMTVHSFSEGVGVGVSFGDGERLGVFITAAIAVHNIPEGLAIALVMIPRGATVASAAAWSVFSSLPQPLMAAPAFAFVEAFSSFLPVGLGFAAGAMVWLVLVELVPDARSELDGRALALWLGASVATMTALQLLFLAR
jgi:zinc transporter, ZIP family